MSEYIEREALIKDVRLLPRLAPYNSVLYSSVQRAIFNAPAADVVEVVRCKDCVCCDTRYPAKEIGKEALIGYFCTVINSYRLPTDFCSYGARKEVAEG